MKNLAGCVLDGHIFTSSRDRTSFRSDRRIKYRIQRLLGGGMDGA